MTEKSESPPSRSRQRARSTAIPFRHIFRSTFLILWGALFPLIFLLLASGFERPDWQSGQYGDYCLLLFYWPNLAPIYPFVLFSATGIVALAWRPHRAHRKLWVRYAVLSGLGVWLAILVPWTGGVSDTFDPGSEFVTIVLSPIFGAAVTLPFAWVAAWAVPKPRDTDEIVDLTGILGVALLVCTLPWFSFWLVVLVPAAPLAVLTYGWGSYLCLRRIKPNDRRLSLKTLLLIVAWLSANFAAWRIAVNMMLAEYASLPTEAPEDCFVASAAARGHRQFVGSDDERPVNWQLRRLKAGELILRQSTPRLHALLRWSYNRLGPQAASLLANRWLADMAYVGLKPCELLACLILKIAGVSKKRVYKLYRH